MLRDFFTIFLRHRKHESRLRLPSPAAPNFTAPIQSNAYLQAERPEPCPSLHAARAAVLTGDAGITDTAAGKGQ